MMAERIDLVLTLVVAIATVNGQRKALFQVANYWSMQLLYEQPLRDTAMSRDGTVPKHAGMVTSSPPPLPFCTLKATGCVRKKMH